MEFHALAQLEADALAFVQFFPAFGKTGNELEVGTAIGQAVKDIGGDRCPLNEERVDRIPAARILRRRDGHLAGGKGRGGGKCGAGESESYERRRQSPFERCHYLFLFRCLRLCRGL
ncbi:hypothetical protein D3C73_675370 [compost metagenome]